MYYSIIKDYTNKRGQTHKAHFSPNGKYLGSVANTGDKPFVLTRYKPKKVNEVPESVPEVQDKPIKLFKIPEVQDKPVIIEDCDESEEETETESEEETESESESEEETESESESEEEYEEQEQFTKGRYRGLDGYLYEITGLTAKFAYVTSVKKDGTLREVNQRNDGGSPTGRRKIQGNSIYNNGVKILTTSCKIK
jgi:hypothetical protein